VIAQEKEPYAVRLERKSWPSVFFVNETSVFRDNYPAKFNEELVRFLIEMFSDPGEIVQDPMCGSGTVPRVANQLGRIGIGSDINEDALKIAEELDPTNEYLNDDARSTSFKDNTADLILTSPSFGISIDAKHEKYGDSPRDIANCRTYEQWRQNFRGCLVEYFRLTKPGRLCIIETRPRRVDWEPKPLWDWILHDAELAGFKFFDMIIEIQSPYSKFPIKDTTPIGHRRSYPMHSFLLMFLKPEFASFTSPPYQENL